MNKSSFSKSIVLSLSVLSLSLTACKTNDALDSTIAVSGKIDQTNATVAQTNGKIDATNQAVVDTNQKIDKTNQAVVDTNALISKTNNSIHLQTLYFAIKDMRDQDNWDLLRPSFLILAAAQTFGKEATSQELADFAKVFKRTTEAGIDEFKDSNEKCLPYATKKDSIGAAIDTASGQLDTDKASLASMPDLPKDATDDAKKASEDAKKALSAQIDADQKALNDLNSELADAYAPCAFAYNRNKMATIAAVQAVFGLAPQDKIEALVKDQIVSGGAETKYAYFALNSRFGFLRDVRYENEVKQLVMDSAQANPGVYSLGVEIVKNMDYILNLGILPQLNGFRFSFKSLAPDGFTAQQQYPMVQVKVAADDSLALWSGLTANLKNLNPKFADQSAQIQSDINGGIQTYNVVSVESVNKTLADGTNP